MKDLNEIRLNDSGVLILDGHRVLSPVIPRSYKDIDNDIVIKGDSLIEGAVYTRKLSIERGDLTIGGAVYVKEVLSTEMSHDGKIEFRKAVAAGRNVEMNDRGRKMFYADLNGQYIGLKNAVVAANIFASKISLENCVVLGGVFAGESLEMKHCVVGTFNSQKVKIEEVNYMLYPSAFSVYDIEVISGASLINLTLADWGNLMLGYPQSKTSGYIQLNWDSDVQEVKLDDSSVWKSYSVACRVLTLDLLNMRDLKNHFIISAGSLNGQLINEVDLGTSSTGETIKLNLDTIGQFFMDVIAGKIEIQQFDAQFSFDELKQHYAQK